MTSIITPRRALLSVSDKTGVVDFARALITRGVHLLSTGGTHRLLQEAGIKVTEVSEYTGFPEMMDGRVKTLHPLIHGGILGRRGVDDRVMAEHGIQGIDLVVVNLYPFAQTVARPGCTLDEAIEQIDIGGPTMVRAAAKNHRHVGIVVNPADYQRLILAMDQDGGGLSAGLRFDLAVAAFEHTAAYDGHIANYLGARDLQGQTSHFARTFNMQYRQSQLLRYGENPHQRAAFYKEQEVSGSCIGTAQQLQGKELSFNNIADTDAALECVKSFSEPACVIVKHANPCGVAVSSEGILAAYERAYATDQESAFGGIIAFNRPLDAATVQSILDRQFVEVIIAPGIDDEALVCAARKPAIRILTCPAWHEPTQSGFDFKKVQGGLLVQDLDTGMIQASDLNMVTRRKPDAETLQDLLFVWKVAKFVKSNAIVYGRDLRTLGIGAGQMSRVNSARIAAIKAEHAGLSLKGACMASDAFFPFRDGIDQAAQSGIRAIIQPGGSIRDPEVIAAADEADIAMVFTGMRHFRH